MNASSTPPHWKQISPDLVVGAVDRYAQPGAYEQTETYHCLGITDTPCYVEIEGVGAAAVGPDVVRRHVPGDRLLVTAGPYIRAQWVLLSPSMTDRAAPPFTRPSLTALARLRQALHRVVRCADPMLAEEIALQAFTLAADESACRHAKPTPREARLVAAANDALLAGYAKHVRVGLLARDLDVSPSYLVRTYRACEGITLHERLTRLRIASALDRLAAGASDLTALALDLGFSSHSHFSASFRKRVGASPSAFRLSSQI